MQGKPSKSPTRPVLRYHGGKWRSATTLQKFFPDHRVYVEPFGGGASVLMRKPRAYAEVYNDLADEVVNVFRVLRDPETAHQLYEDLVLTPFARDEFKAAYAPTDDPIERARRAIVRAFMGFGSASFNAKHGTGFRSNSKRSGTTPALDWRNYPEQVPAFVERLRGVVIENKDALTLMPTHDSTETLFYVDPPYPECVRAEGAIRGVRQRYIHEMTDDQHRALGEGLHKLDGMIVLSGRACDLYDVELFSTWRRYEFDHLDDGARKRIEVVWLNPACANALDTKLGGGATRIAIIVCCYNSQPFGACPLENSNIPWCHHTFNPWLGCFKVSDGCKHCYAEALVVGRMGKPDLWGPPKTTNRQHTAKAYWAKLRTWNKAAMREGITYRVFCASLADVFENHPALPPMRMELWQAIKAAPFLEFLMLTKRPENILGMLPEDWDYGYHNVWLGTSVENDENAWRLDELREVRARRGVAVTFVSHEPALGPLVDANLEQIDWHIYGGESGPHRRPDDEEWRRMARDRSLREDRAFYFKQSSDRYPDRGYVLDGEIIRGYPFPRALSVPAPFGVMQARVARATQDLNT